MRSLYFKGMHSVKCFCNNMNTTKIDRKARIVQVWRINRYYLNCALSLNCSVQCSCEQ